MKIALVRTASNILRFGGYNIQEIGLANALLKYGISTDVYARFSNIETDQLISEAGGERVMVRPLRGSHVFKEIMFYPTLTKNLCNGGYDVVQLLDDSQMMLPYIFKALKKKGIKTILWQGMYRDFSGKIALMMQKLYDTAFVGTIDKFSDLKIAKTNYAKKYLENKNYHNIITIPVGLVPVEYEKNEDIEKQVNSFKIAHDKILLYIGAIEPRRSPLFLLELLKSFDREKVGLIMIGKGPKYEEVRSVIRSEGLSECVLQLAEVPNANLKYVFDISDIFLLPTNYEIYGMVILEALQYGVPCISTPEAGPETILTDKIFGCCVPLNIALWHHKVEYYFNNLIEDNYRTFRTAQVDNYYRWDKIAERYHEIIKLVASGNIEACLTSK